MCEIYTYNHVSPAGGITQFPLYDMHCTYSALFFEKEIQCGGNKKLRYKKLHPPLSRLEVHVLKIFFLTVLRLTRISVVFFENAPF